MHVNTFNRFRARKTITERPEVADGPLAADYGSTLDPAFDDMDVPRVLVAPGVVADYTGPAPRLERARR